MTDSRIRVSKALYVRALADAIDWQESFLASHDPDAMTTVGHCGPSAHTERCEAYRDAHALLRRYKRAYAKAGGARPEPEGRSVPLHEIRENWPAEKFGTDETAAKAGKE
jgi:hypothetical protein